MREIFKSRGQQMLGLSVVMTEQDMYSALVQDDSEKNQDSKKAVSCYENRVAFQKSCSQCKSKYGKQQQSCREYRQAREIFYAVTQCNFLWARTHVCWH